MTDEELLQRAEEYIKDSKFSDEAQADIRNFASHLDSLDQEEKGECKHKWYAKTTEDGDYMECDLCGEEKRLNLGEPKPKETKKIEKQYNIIKRAGFYDDKVLDVERTFDLILQHINLESINQ